MEEALPRETQREGLGSVLRDPNLSGSSWRQSQTKRRVPSTLRFLTQKLHSP